MNRISSFLAAFSFVGLFSCHHHEEDHPAPMWEISSTQIQVTGKEIMLYTLPENFQRENPVISQKPSESSISEIVRNDAGLWVLRYQSANGQNGMDELTIDSEDEAAERAGHHGHCGRASGQKPLFGPNKGKGPEVHYRLQVKIMVEESKDVQYKLSLKGGSQ